MSARQPVLEPHVVQFSKATAKPYLKRTESQWNIPTLDRHGGTYVHIHARTTSEPVGSSISDQLHNVRVIQIPSHQLCRHISTRGDNEHQARLSISELDSTLCILFTHNESFSVD